MCFIPSAAQRDFVWSFPADWKTTAEPETSNTVESGHAISHDGDAPTQKLYQVRANLRQSRAGHHQRKKEWSDHREDNLTVSWEKEKINS